MPNMKQIAQMADVSLGTVSHVLNGSARVREPLRRRVLEAVESSLKAMDWLGPADAGLVLDRR